MLDLRYKQEQQVIQVSLEENKHLWGAIRTVFEENAEEIVTIGPYSLCLPVWSFLSCRQGLVYVLRKHRLPFCADEKVKEFLHSASIHEADYDGSVNSLPISGSELVSTLRARGFVRALKDYQLRNVAKLAAFPSGATFSVPGAGKTTEALAFYYYKKSPESKLLVVSPKNAFAAWEEQIRSCILTPPKVVRLIGGEKSIHAAIDKMAEIYLITYQQLPNVKSIVADFLLNNPVFMFLDESHRIKRGTEGQWCSTVLSLSHLPVSKLVMSGTPLPNSLLDLVPQFNFIFPEVGADQENIKSLIKPVFVRTTKSELDLPSVQRIETLVQFRPQQRHLYELIRSEEARRAASINVKDRNKLRHIGKSIIRLLQLASNPALLAKNSIDLPEQLFDALAEGDGPKIEYACYRARKLAQLGKKVIIWSGFVENVETIAMRLSDIGADYIHGGVEAGSDDEEDTRERKIAAFHNDPHAFVLVANPAACAEGISLHTVCHYAIYVDRNYNAAQYLQSEDRIHRLGLSKDILTTVEILITPDTIDESIKRRLNLKVQRMAEVLEDSSLSIEPVEPDLEVDGTDYDDIMDFMKHLSRK